MVAIDQEPLRSQAADACTRALGRLEQARAGWHRFERKDKPAFVRWRAREFGALLSRAREVETQIRDAQALIHEVQLEMRRGFQDPYSAYQQVMFRRANPFADGPVEFSNQSKTNGSHRPVSDFEKETLFQDWVRKSLGTNPDKMDDTAYSKSFEAFKSHMFRASVETHPRPNEYRKARPVIEPEEMDKEAATPVDARVKELYRTLVRRLHPDLRADGSVAASTLWHEVQEAYSAGDVARLEILLALSDIAANRAADQTLAQMLALQFELQRAVTALEKSLREAEEEDAWNFAQLGPRADLRLQVERQLKLDLASRTQRLKVLTETIAEWERGPTANRKLKIARAG